MPESFGARLRQRREQQQITLTTIAKQTKIKLSLLEGLERDDVSHWPGGIFRRAFIRAYAHAIALEPDVVVREFLELHPDPTDVVATVPALEAAGDDASATARPPTRLQSLVGSVVTWFSRLRPGVVPTHQPALMNLTAAAPTAATRTVKTTSATSEVRIKASPASQPDLLAAAHLCTEFGRLDETREAAPLLRQAARILDAVGLIVWVWHPQATELRPALTQGYSNKVLAQLPRVGRDTDNATAAAFRSARTCIVNGRDQASGAVVVPLMTPAGCVGVLAIELEHGGELRESVRALGAIFAAQLARVVGDARFTEAADRRLA